MTTWYTPAPDTAAHRVRTVIRWACAAALAATWVALHILIPC